MRVFAFLAFAALAGAQQQDTFLQQIQKIMNRPDYRHSHFGIEFYSLDTNEAIFQLNEQEFFGAGSTIKLLTTGSALAAFGEDYRFHTRIYRTGPLRNGTVTGDLILVASGDPNLSNRILPDHTLAFENVDHSYGGKPVPGDPLAVLRQMARDVAGRGIRRITGRVLVDASLFPEGTRESGTSVVISPVSLNDNLIDISIAPGVVGAPAKLEGAPKTAYLHLVNETRTIAPGGKMAFHWGRDVVNPDGTHTVTVTGEIPVGAAPALQLYRVPEPGIFATVALVQVLREAGIAIKSAGAPVPVDFKNLSASYSDGNLVAEHVSLPLAQAVRVIMKVSQNLHACMLPYLLGSLRGVTAGPKNEDAEQAGFDVERGWLDQAGLDSNAVTQRTGADSYGVTPDFMTRYLAYMSRQAFYPAFRHALPVLGRDGSLWDIQVQSPAAEHVMAKTGTDSSRNPFGKNVLITGKGLAGYMRTKDGKELAFAIYADNVTGDSRTITHVIGDALGEIAAAAYDSSLK